MEAKIGNILIGLVFFLGNISRIRICIPLTSNKMNQSYNRGTYLQLPTSPHPATLQNAIRPVSSLKEDATHGERRQAGRLD